MRPSYVRRVGLPRSKNASRLSGSSSMADPSREEVSEEARGCVKELVAPEEVSEEVSKNSLHYLTLPESYLRVV
jgi:hypothetical protein